MLQLAYVPKATKTRCTVAVDFDGTIVQHQFPKIGFEAAGAFRWLQRFKELDAELILWTIRADDSKHGSVLTQAVEHCRANGVEFDTVNVKKGQHHWTSSVKLHADIYIDEASLGCPLCPPESYENARPYADWSVIGPAVESKLQERLVLLGIVIPPRSW